MIGYVKISRGLLEHPIWLEKPFSDGQAWIDLIGLANYKTVKKKKGDKVVAYKRGTVYRSILSLADRWGWDRKKVRRFLSALQSDQMVVVNGSTHGTTITIVNYGKYQNVGTTKVPTDGQQMGQPMGQQLPTRERMIKNDKECIKNDMLRFRASDQPPTLEEVRDYFKAAGLTTSPERFWRHYDENGWTLSGGGKVRSWKKAAQSWKEDWPHGEETRGTDRGDRNPRQRAGYGEAEAELFGQMS